MSDSLSRSTGEVKNESTKPVCSDRADDIGPQSLELFPLECSGVENPSGRPESLELFPSEYTEEVENPPRTVIVLSPSDKPSLFEYILAPPIIETVHAPGTPSPARHLRRTPKRRTISAAARRYSTHAAAAISQPASVVACGVAESMARFAGRARIAAQWVTVSIGNVAVHATAAFRRVGQMPSPQPIAATGALLALIAAVGTYLGLTDMSARRALKGVSSTAVSSDATEPAVLAPVPVNGVTSFQRLRPAIPQITAPIVSRASIAVRENTRPPNDTRAVRTVLNQYRDAMSILDITAVRAVWPNADVSVLRREFAGRSEQNLEFEACRISSSRAAATASCVGVIESGFRAGTRRPRLERKRWEFRLRKVARRWTITAVTTQRG